MRILFLRVNSRNFCAFPPLGFLYIASYLRARNDYTVKIYDGLLTNSSDRAILRQIAEFQPDVIGVTGLTLDRMEIHQTAQLIKHKFPGVVLVWGGAHASSNPQDIMANSAVDFAVLGEGEISSLNLFKSLETGADPSNINGIAGRKNGEVFINTQNNFIEDINDLPSPAWDLINLDEYFRNIRKPTGLNIHTKSRRNAPVFTSRGCPYNCVFCHNVFGKKFRALTPERVVSEIKYLKEIHGVKEIEIADDIFNLDHERAMEIAQAIKDENLDIYFSFPNGLRADLMSTELIDLLVEIGTYRICYSIESASDKIQAKIKKNLNIRKSREIIEYTFNKGISVGVSYILGFLDENLQSMNQTIKHALSIKASTVSFFFLTPFPGTEIYNQARMTGKFADEYVPTHFFGLDNNISGVTDSELRRLLKSAYARYYLKPKRIYRFIKTTPVFKFMLQKIILVLAINFRKLLRDKNIPLDEAMKSYKRKSRFV